MKKFFVTAAVALFVSLTSFAADIKKVNQKVLAAFEKEFATATHVTWEVLKGEEIYHASFLYSGEVMDVYYSAEAELIAIGRNISQERLPLLVNKTLRNSFSNYQFRQASEYMSADTTSYIITLENEKQTIVVRIYNDGHSEVMKKTKK